MQAPATDTSFEQRALACLPHIATFALSLTRETASADDLVQETFLRAFRARETFRPELDMRRWLFTICKNVFLREQERAQREPLALDADEPTDETMGAIRLHIEIRAAGESVMFDHADLGDALRNALRALPETMRVVVVLVDQLDYDYADAAALLGIPIGTVRSRLFRARRLLQRSLIHHGHDAGFTASFDPRGTT